jgi:hypothetical protein
MLGFLSPLKWRENTWGAKSDPEACKRHDALHVYHIPTTFPQLSEFGHHFKIKRGIDVWRFQRDGQQWTSFGFTDESVPKQGKVFLSICTEQTSVSDNKFMIGTMIQSVFDTSGNFARDSACNWRFMTDFQALLETLEGHAGYSIDPENAGGWTIN